MMFRPRVKDPRITQVYGFQIHAGAKILTRQKGVVLFDQEIIPAGCLPVVDDDTFLERALDEESLARKGELILIKERSALAHVYVSEEPDLTQEKHLKKSLLGAWLKAPSGRILIANCFEFDEWLSETEKRVPPNMIEIPPGTYCIDIHTVDTPADEINAAVENALGKRAVQWLDRVELAAGLSFVVFASLGCLALPVLFLFVAAFWFPEIWKWLGLGALAVLVPIGLSILLLSVGYFRRLAERREEIKLNYPEYIIVLRPAPADFDPAQAKAPIVESVFHVPILKEL